MYALALNVVLAAVIAPRYYGDYPLSVEVCTVVAAIVPFIVLVHYATNNKLAQLQQLDSWYAILPAAVHVIVLMTNDITDRYYQWPMSQAQFAEFLTDKYGAGSEDGVHHYELVKSSGKTTSSGPSDYSHRVEVNSDEDNAITVTNREYEERLQDKYRQIKLLDRRYITDFVDEFNNLISE